MIYRENVNCKKTRLCGFAERHKRKPSSKCRRWKLQHKHSNKTRTHLLHREHRLGNYGEVGKLI